MASINYCTKEWKYKTKPNKVPTITVHIKSYFSFNIIRYVLQHQMEDERLNWNVYEPRKKSIMMNLFIDSNKIPKQMERQRLSKWQM